MAHVQVSLSQWQTHELLDFIVAKPKKLTLIFGEGPTTCVNQQAWASDHNVSKRFC